MRDMIVQGMASMGQIGIGHYLTLSVCLFVLGVLGLIRHRRNIIIMFMSIELLLLSVNLNFVSFSAYLGDLLGQVFTFFILTVAAAEAAIGLAILVIFFRHHKAIEMDNMTHLKG